MKPAIAMPGPRFGRARRYLTTHRLTRVRLPDPAHRAFFAARRSHPDVCPPTECVAPCNRVPCRSSRVARAVQPSQYHRQ
ncbi:hypothetical protein AQ810_06440 [Burkholderia pseudomallei]|nr:hypothetical protein AQ810_06440 [Burkholderia pseudomallei]